MTSDGTLVQDLKGHVGAVINVGYSQEGDVLVSGSQDGTVRFWGLTDGELLGSAVSETPDQGIK